MTDYYVNASVAIGSGSGTLANPWNFEDATDGTRSISAGDRILFQAGTYSNLKTMGGETWNGAYLFEDLTGTALNPIHIMPVPDARVIIDGSFVMETASNCAYLHIHDFEFAYSIAEPGSISPGSAPSEIIDTNWGTSGIACSVPGCKIYNNVVRNGAQAYSIWVDAAGCEVYGNICFDYGWISTDRAHGHGIYTQNDGLNGTRVLKHNIFGPGKHARPDNGHWSLHAYATNTYVRDFEVTENLVLGSFKFQCENNTMNDIVCEDNIIASVRVGSNSTDEGNGTSAGEPDLTDTDIVFRDNTLINSVVRVVNGVWSSITMTGVRIFKTVSDWKEVDEGTQPGLTYDELATFSDVSSSGGTDEVELWQNVYDGNRATLVIIDFSGNGSVDVSAKLEAWLGNGDDYRIQHFRDVWGTAVASGTWSTGDSLSLNVIEDLANDGTDETGATDGFIVFRTPASAGVGTVERSLSAPVKAAVASALVKPVFLVSADFIDGSGDPDPVRLCTRSHDISWDGHTWQGGLSELLEIGEINETSDGASERLTVGIDAIPSDWFTSITGTKYQGRAMTVYFGAVDPTTNVLLNDPVTLFSGEMDVDRIVDDGTLSTMTITGVSKMSNQLKPRVYRYTHNDQEALNTGETDDGLEFVAELQDVELKWGQG